MIGHVTAGRGMIVACIQLQEIEVHRSLNDYGRIEWLRLAGLADF